MKEQSIKKKKIVISAAAVVVVASLFGLPAADAVPRNWQRAVTYIGFNETCNPSVGPKAPRCDPKLNLTCYIEPPIIPGKAGRCILIETTLEGSDPLPPLFGPTATEEPPQPTDPLPSPLKPIRTEQPTKTVQPTSTPTPIVLGIDQVCNPSLGPWAPKCDEAADLICRVEPPVIPGKAGTCRPRGPIDTLGPNEICKPTSPGSPICDPALNLGCLVDPDLSSSGAWGICQTHPSLGDTCNNRTLPCSANLTCSAQGFCVPLRTQPGESCGGFTLAAAQCAAPLSCVHLNTSVPDMPGTCLVRAKPLGKCGDNLGNSGVPTLCELGLDCRPWKKPKNATEPQTCRFRIVNEGRKCGVPIRGSRVWPPRCRTGLICVFEEGATLEDGGVCRNVTDGASN